MMSMTTRYGSRDLMRKAATLLCCALFICAVAAAPPRLLVLADSLAAGYGLAAPEAFQAQLTAALQAQRRPVTLIDAALVELGGNDGLRGTDPHELETNLAAILDALAARHIPVLLTGIYAPPNLGAEYERQFRAVFDRLGQRPGVLYDPFFLQGVARDPALNQADGIHPNPAGVKLVVARLLPLVERLLDGARPHA